jgi:sec-independent protein translocase protein TatA
MLMDIGGNEWIIIILLGLFLIFGTKRLPQFSRTMGKAVGEYEKARAMIKREMEDAAEKARGGYRIPKIEGPVATEREKLETIAASLGITDFSNIADEDLRKLISKRMAH